LNKQGSQKKGKIVHQLLGLMDTLPSLKVDYASFLHGNFYFVK